MENKNEILNNDNIYNVKDTKKRSTHCRVCNIKLNPLRPWHSYKHFCSEECRLSEKESKLKEYREKLKEQRKNEKSENPLVSLKPLALEKQELLEISFPLTNVLEHADTKKLIASNATSSSVKSKDAVRIGLMQKIRKHNIPYTMEIIYKKVERNPFCQFHSATHKKYKVFCITPKNMLLFLDKLRLEYEDKKTYISLNSYKFGYELVKEFINIINNYEIIDVKNLQKDKK